MISRSWGSVFERSILFSQCLRRSPLAPAWLRRRRYRWHRPLGATRDKEADFGDNGSAPRRPNHWNSITRMGWKMKWAVKNAAARPSYVLFRFFFDLNGCLRETPRSVSLIKHSIKKNIIFVNFAVMGRLLAGENVGQSSIIRSVPINPSAGITSLCSNGFLSILFFCILATVAQ